MSHCKGKAVAIAGAIQIKNKSNLWLTRKRRVKEYRIWYCPYSRQAFNKHNCYDY